MKKHLFWFLIPVLAISILSCNRTRPGKPRILVFSKTKGFRHTSIEPGKLGILKMGQENDFLVDTTEDAVYFNEDSLKKYAAVVFLNTTLDVLNQYQEADFERYIQSGGGFVGVHSATDTEYEWGWYGRLVGAYFQNHPKPQQAKLIVSDQSHSSTKHLPKEWTRTDEWYNFKKLNKDVHVLISIDEKSYEGGKNPDGHPMAWYHEFDGGRSFYTEFGHTDESWKEENFIKHLLGGIQYAMADNQELDYSKAKTIRVPEEDRFTKTMLTESTLFEPTEMTILPNLDVLIAQRRGELMLYKQKDSSIKQAGFLNVYWKTEVPNVNAEEGVLGLQADPDFAKNHFVYIFYSPKDSAVNRLSRFRFENDTLDLTSEKVILQLYSQRNICCHTGGSIAFGEGRTLFVSTGDNSTPFDEPNQKFVNRGFGPLDDRPGHEQYDARRSSGNTNDLRGKILRIVIKEDGTYEVPDGNLFAKGQVNTKPEIYVMGNRNPYRISVDKKNGFLYWGEVGPDAGSDSLETRGPRGYDEVNQARKAGNFGWPLFVGNNYAYHKYNYATGTTGPAFDPANPINDSRNNTGIQNLPAAQPAFIWYPYDVSPDFPSVGTGGRNAMTGPIFYSEMYPEKTRLPAYYNNKVFIYDWIRGWIKAVTLLPNGDFDKMEPFMQNTKFNSPIDMEMGPDGKIYILEYGTGWFSKNKDAGLSRLDYNGGNRPPKVAGINVDKTSGTLPLTVKANIDVRDPENDPLKYRWHFGKTVKETNEPTADFTFDKPGDYEIYAEVLDKAEATGKSELVSIYAGNEAPHVNIDVEGNQSFYFPNVPVRYKVSIIDNDDTTKDKDLTNLIVSADYTEGSDKAAASKGHQVMTEAMIGKNMMLSLDCKTCHKVDEKSIGPSYMDIATKYEKDAGAESYLVNKIIKGGGGVWGEVAMAAHPDLKESDARQIVRWIESLKQTAVKKSSLPPTGIAPKPDKPISEKTILVLSATYTDKGGKNLKPLIGSNAISLQNNKLGFRRNTEVNGFGTYTLNGTRYMLTPRGTGWFATDSVDLSSVNRVSLRAGWQNPPEYGFTFELHLDKPDGQLLGQVELPGAGKPNIDATNKKPSFRELSMKFAAVNDGKFHKLYLVSKAKDPKETAQVGIQWIEFLVK